VLSVTPSARAEAQACKIHRALDETRTVKATCSSSGETRRFNCAAGERALLAALESAFGVAVDRSTLQQTDSVAVTRVHFAALNRRTHD